MMYDQTAIQAVIDLIDWAEPIPVDPVEIVLTSANKVGTSGRSFNSFHALMTVENIFKSIPEVTVDNDYLNEYLYKIKTDCAREVLEKVFDLNPRANYAYTDEFRSINYQTEYTGVITSKKSVFNDAVGYLAAVKGMQLFLSTKRSNENERTIGMTYEQFKVDLEGLKDRNGNILSKGLRDLFEEAIQKAIDLLFPVETKSKKRVFGRAPW